MQKLKQYTQAQVDAGNFDRVIDVQNYLADQLGLKDSSSIRQWCAGIYTPSARHCRKLEEITGIPRAELNPEIFGD